MEITFIFVKFEDCILSGIGARSIPVSRQVFRQAGRLADETLIMFDNLKILQWATKRHLACLNKDVALPDIYRQFQRVFRVLIFMRMLI